MNAALAGGRSLRTQHRSCGIAAAIIVLGVLAIAASAAAEGAPTYTLTVSPPPPAGRVIGGGLDCGSAGPAGPGCFATFASGTQVTLVATPAPPFELAGWSGCDTVAGTQCMVTVTSDRTISVNFTGFTLLVSSVSTAGSVSGPGIDCGAGTMNACAAKLAVGHIVTLIATPVAGNRVTGWGGCDTAIGNRCTVTMNAARVVSAGFAPVAVPSLAAATFFGGTGDQRGTGIAVRQNGPAAGNLYVVGNAQPESGASSDFAYLLRYPLPFTTILPTTPTFQDVIGAGTALFGLAAGPNDVYAVGWNYDLSTDAVGPKDVKSVVTRFADAPASSGYAGSTFFVTPNYFAAGGVETHRAAVTTVESGATYVYTAGVGTPCAGATASTVAKYDTAGVRIAAATDATAGVDFSTCSTPTAGGSDARAVAVLNGDVYVAGASSWSHEGDHPNGRPALWRYDADLRLVWRRKDTARTGVLRGVTPLDGFLYTVGNVFTPGVEGSEDYLVQKYDAAGELVWSRTSGGAASDALTGVIGVGSRVFAVGSTRSSGAGGADVVVIEIDPATGATLSTTLFGGALDDVANGVATDGTDLYVVGESRSFATDAGPGAPGTFTANAIGENDIMVLRYLLPGETATESIIVSPVPAGGRVTASGIDCGSGGGADCAQSYPRGTRVTLTATPATGFALAGWIDAAGTAICAAALPSSSQCDVDLTASRTISARFTPAFTLTVNEPANGAVRTGPAGGATAGIDCGGGTHACQRAFAANDRVRLTAFTIPPYHVVTWTGCDEVAPFDCTVTMSAARAVSVAFSVAGVSLRVSPAPVNGSVSGPGIDCGRASPTNICEAGSPIDQPVTLTAMPPRGYDVGSWTGCDSVSGTQCTVTMGSARTVSVTFTLTGAALVVSPRSTTGTVSGPDIDCGPIGTRCDAAFAPGDVVFLTAMPPLAATGYRRVTWTGCETVNELQCTTRLGTTGTTRTISATFVAPVVLTVFPSPTNGSVSTPLVPLVCSSAASTACQAVVPAGEVVTLDAFALPGYRIGLWTGCDAVSGARCTVTMSAARTVSVTFLPPLVLTVSPPTSGSISGPGIACGTPSGSCLATFQPDDVVTLTAFPLPSFQVSAWTGCDATSGTQCTVRMRTARTVSAIFAVSGVALTVSPGPQNGSVSAPGLNCGTPAGGLPAGGSCQSGFRVDEVVYLSAMPAPGFYVGAWTGCDTVTGPQATQCSVTMRTARTVSATFVPPVPVIVSPVPTNGTVSAPPSRTGSGINCGGPPPGTCQAGYAPDEIVTLTAFPQAGFQVGPWNGCDTFVGPQCTVRASTARTVSVIFAVPGVALTVAPVPTNGTVSGRGINCGEPIGGACQAGFEPSEQVTLTAMPAAGYRVGTWNGCDSTTETSCTVRMSAARTVSVTFALSGVALTISPVPLNGMISGSPSTLGPGLDCRSSLPAFPTRCQAGYPSDEIVMLSALPNAGYEVGTWTGCDTVNGAECRVRMNAPRTVSMTFKLRGVVLTVTPPPANGSISGPGGLGLAILCSAALPEVPSPPEVPQARICQAGFQPFEMVTLLAAPATGYRVGTWTGCETATGTQCTVRMATPRTVSVTFVQPIALTVSPRPTKGSVLGAGISCGSAGTTCQTSFTPPAVVALVASASPGYRVGAWTGCDTPAGDQCVVAMTSAKAVSVAFVPTTPRVLAVAPSPVNGAVSGPGISCGAGTIADCTEALGDGEVAVLSAAPVSGYYLGGWSGCDTVSGGQCIVTMSQARSVAASFGAPVPAGGRGDRFRAELGCPATAARSGGSIDVRVTFTNATPTARTIARGALAFHAGDTRLLGPTAFAIVAQLDAATVVDCPGCAPAVVPTTAETVVRVMIPSQAPRGTFLTVGMAFVGRRGSDMKRNVLADGACLIEVR